MKNKQYVVERIENMRKRWGMYAITKEAFSVQIGMMLEIFYDISLNEFDRILIKGNQPEKLADRIDEDFANMACDKASKLIKNIEK